MFSKCGWYGFAVGRIFNGGHLNYCSQLKAVVKVRENDSCRKSKAEVDDASPSFEAIVSEEMSRSYLLGENLQTSIKRQQYGIGMTVQIIGHNGKEGEVLLVTALP